VLHRTDSRGTFLPWSQGSAEPRLDEERQTGRLPVAVWCRFGALPHRELAMLDTGAHWTLIGPELIESLGDQLGAELDSLTMSTRIGNFKGTLHRLPIHLIAEQGADVTVEATCLALPDWEGPTILGFHGFLERLRFALEPGMSADTPGRFYFGGA
jgi:hypothetical protein